jgi:sensor histidine kinase YesM
MALAVEGWYSGVMTVRDTSRRRWLPYLLGLAVWTLLGLFLASQAHLLLWAARYAREDLLRAPQEASWWELLRLQLAEAYLWAGLAILVFWLGSRFPLDKKCWLRNGLAHVLASLVFAVIETGLSVAVNHLLRQEIMKPTFSWKILQFFFLAKLHQNVIIYWVILAVSQGIAYYRKYRDRELQASQLEARLAQTRLQALKMQLQPHFLFNTLNAISALIHQDVELADRMIARLGDLLRSTLENADVQLVPLQQELDFIGPYLEIEKARLGPRLTVDMKIDPETRSAHVPNLLLQPLVENAIRHGIAPRSEPGRIEIQAHRAAGQLHLQVSDDGPGLANGSGAPFKEGIGLANTRARLAQLYGETHQFTLTNGAGRGLTVAITIPFQNGPEVPAGRGAQES